MRELYICGSHYQVMNVLNIVYHKQDVSEKTLFVVNQFKKAADIADKIKGTNLFSNVYLLQPSEIVNMPFGIKRYVLAALNYLMPLRSLKDRFRGCEGVRVEKFINAFDVIYEVGVSHTAAAVLKLNPDAEFVLYDEGTGSYRENVMTVYRSRLKLLFCKIFGVGSYVRKPSKLLVNNVKMCRGVAVPADRIFPLPEIDDGFKKLCGKIFEMDTEWKNSVLWLSQPATFLEGKTDGRISAREKIRSHLLPYKDRITVRMHYRDSDYEFYRDFDIDKGQCGWELLLMNAGKKVNDLVLISVYSSAQITPKFIFDTEPTLIFLYRLYSTGASEEQITHMEEMIEDMRKAYRDPEKIYTPKTPEELSAVLQKIFS